MIHREQGLLRKQVLDDQDRAAIEQLAALCSRHEGLDLGMLLEPSEPAPNHETNQLLFKEKGSLVGFMNLPPGLEPEICGIVHPHFRRQGIGRAMLAAAREEYRRRGERSLLL